MSEDKFCVDCAHVKKEHNHYLCEKFCDPVTGDPIDCRVMRGEWDACSGGIHFQRREKDE